ncbi:NCS2 family permease [Lachnospiraceae bacterium MD1]|uniref:NCS2 family permease n=1 Tax=Variimorphobacter saccharofermentans TaxID=2755051 RepID=A0A839K3G8_9FIRM|nr:NCS2 family permease [Variimorphobacter saccharofermentans]MBB2183722.1 NCS2 family permease [Variimorphobacter saccharofermentans]
MEKFFKLKEHGTSVSTEVVAGITTFFAMAYIIFVNPGMLSQTGMPAGAVFLATIIASVAGTLVMGLFANVPYAQAPGMGLNAFFTYTVCFGLGFTWQEALMMVFICGIINVIITVTKIRKLIIKAIPESLQHAIGGGIGIFVAYIGLLNIGMVNFESGVPALSNFDNKGLILALVGIVITFILLILKVKGAIIIGIAATTVLGIPLKVVDLSTLGATAGLADSFKDLGTTFGAAFGSEGLGSLFSDASRIPLVIMTIFAFSLSDTFDTIGTFIGTGRKSGIFDEADEKALEEGTGFKSKMDKALFADSIATSIGAIVGTSNTTTYVESAAGIGAGGRTGLTSVVTAALFLLSIFLAPIVGIVPTQATAPALIAVGIMMISSFKEIKWDELEEAIPAFFAAIFMALCYSISYGIAGGFIFYVIVKIVKGKAKDINPVLWVATALFIANFVILAII